MSDTAASIDINNTTKTKLESEDKPYIIEHLNEEHQHDLIGFTQIYLQTNGLLSGLTIQQVNITEIYQQGIELQIIADYKEPTNIFIQFPQKIFNINELQNQYIALRQQADKIRGKDSIKITDQNFILKDKYMVSENMLRLVLSANQEVLKYKNSAGYAYLFSLKTGLDKFDKQLSREQCYYTLRKVFTQDKTVTAWVDVYLHTYLDGENTGKVTSGGRWAKSLQLGDNILSKREFPEKTEHLEEGQALLIADETSLPTVARLLEVWDNPIAPIVVNITNTQADQSYIKDAAPSKMAKDFTLLPLVINYNQADLAKKIDQLISHYTTENTVKIDKVWGALEAKTTKQLRRLLSESLQLSRSESLLKVYWRKG